MTKLHYLTDQAIHSFIDNALREDIGEGDQTTLASIPESLSGKAELRIKSDGILAGVELAEKIFKQYDHRLKLHKLKTDGEKVHKGEIGFLVEGPIRSILSTERIVLNCMQRMSGIATYTHKLSQLISGTKAKLMDTRKTTPNFRLPEKWAVAIGGGVNHRFALYDMIMLKDNHVDASGGISNAVERTVQYLHATGKRLKIEVETRNLEEVKEALRTMNVDVIMLDNMTTADMRTAVELIGNKCETEASGGITEGNLLEVAKCGVDFISIGALTHSVKSLDLSLKIVL